MVGSIVGVVLLAALCLVVVLVSRSNKAGQDAPSRTDVGGTPKNGEGK